MVIDLRRYYLDSIDRSDYYHRFYELIDGVNTTYNIFDGLEETEEHRFDVYDALEAIEKFRMLCQPGSEPYKDEDKCWFFLVSYYLKSCGYSITQFPNILNRPPDEPSDFTYGEIRDKAFALGLNDDNIIRHATRRQIVRDMEFVKDSSVVTMGESLDQMMQLISVRNARFENMETDEKLREIANLIENLLKEDGKYRRLNYKQVVFEYVDDGMVKSLRSKLQCFRHSSAASLTERDEYSVEQKAFLVDYGVTICNAIYSLIK